MNKLIKKILTDKRMRSLMALSTFLATIVAIGRPWHDI